MWSSGRLEEDTCYMLRDFKFYKTANNYNMMGYCWPFYRTESPVGYILFPRARINVDSTRGSSPLTRTPSLSVPDDSPHYHPDGVSSAYIHALPKYVNA